MIDLYTWSTPNGRKASIMLEELALAYRVFEIDITKGEQHDPEFLAISPNNKIPAIVDHDAPDGGSLSIFESGAILIYLAEKCDRFLPSAFRPRLAVLQWLMFQMGNVGPFFGQAHHFRRFAPEKVPYAIERYTNETRRLYSVMDKRLGETAYLAGDDYTIADIATFPWAARHSWQGVDLAEFPNVKRWYDAVWRRPAVKKGYDVP
ncbi:MAG: glutathione binding-like protein [Alphaproteobacteria bacterium]